MTCVSLWYNRTGWPGVKNQLTYLPPKHIYTPHPALARMSTLPEPWCKRKGKKTEKNKNKKTEQLPKEQNNKPTKTNQTNKTTATTTKTSPVKPPLNVNNQ